MPAIKTNLIKTGHALVGDEYNPATAPLMLIRPQTPPPPHYLQATSEPARRTYYVSRGRPIALVRLAYL